MDTIYSQSQEIFNSDKISSLQHAKMNDTDSVPHVSNIISHLQYTNKIGVEFLHFTSNPSRHTMTMESASHPSLLRRDAPSMYKETFLPIGVAIVTLQRKLWPYQIRIATPCSYFSSSGACWLGFRGSPAETRLTVYCWLLISRKESAG
jgi:hypothetical protein